MIASPASLRPFYVRGRRRDYLVPTLVLVDQELGRLSTLLRVRPGERHLLLADSDALLDRRIELMLAGHVDEAVELAQDAA